MALGVGETRRLAAQVVPLNAFNQNITWTSSNDNVASVERNGNGTVTGRGTGTATITATTVDGGFTATSTINVTHATDTRNVSIRVFYHHTFQDIPWYDNLAFSAMLDARRVFDRGFDISLAWTAQHAPATPTMPMDRGDTSGYNATFFYREIYLRNRGPSDLGVLIYRADLDAYGWANSVGGAASIFDFNPSDRTRSVRVLQHELAHNFGVHDGILGHPANFSACTPDSDCIMRGQFFRDPNFDRTGIWCDNHAGELRNNRNRQWR